MISRTQSDGRLRVVIVGGGLAALEGPLALAQLAPDLTDAIVIAPNSEFIDRPMTRCEPFAYGMAHHYPVAEIVHAVGANVLTGELARIDLRARTVRTLQSSDRPSAPR
jgi:NADH dehydrogenase FAD-containing subunit